MIITWRRQNSLVLNHFPILGNSNYEADDDFAIFIISDDDDGEVMFSCYELITKFPTSDYICIAHPFHLLRHPHDGGDDDHDHHLHPFHLLRHPHDAMDDSDIDVDDDDAPHDQYNHHDY